MPARWVAAAAAALLVAVGVAVLVWPLFGSDLGHTALWPRLDALDPSRLEFLSVEQLEASGGVVGVSVDDHVIDDRRLLGGTCVALGSGLGIGLVVGGRRR